MDDEAVKALWDRGDYRIVGDWFADASRSCLDGLDLRGRTVLDIACGTGAVAIEAARRGARVTGVDLTPSMLVEARRRAQAAGFEVALAEASFADLSDHRGFDVATSAFGVMFAEDQAAVAAEVLRTLRPGGIAVVAAWDPAGLLGFPFPGIEALLPSTGGPAFGRWATRQGLLDIAAEVQRIDPALAPHLADVRKAAVVMPFATVEDAVAQMLRWSCGWMALFDALEAHGTAEAGRAALVEHFRRFSAPTSDGVQLTASYAVAHLVRGRPEPQHGLFAHSDEDVLLSPFVLAEADYMLASRLGPPAARDFLDDVAAEAFELIDFDYGDVRSANGITDRYADLHIGIADASLVVIAARFQTLRLLTFDQRHFRTITPLWGGPAFTLLPMDGASATTTNG